MNETHAEMDDPHENPNENSSPRSPFTSQAEEDLLQYRNLSALSILALVFGLGSVASLLYWPFWIIPFLGVVFGLIAITTIRQSSSPTIGLKPAIVGLCLSLLFLFGAPTKHYSSRWYLRRESIAYGDQFITYLLQGGPDSIQKAHRMALPYRSRSPRQLNNIPFASQPGVSELTSLGKNAQFRYVETENQQSKFGKDTVYNAYQVSYVYEGETKIWMVWLLLERAVDTQPNPNVVYWRILPSQGQALRVQR